MSISKSGKLSLPMLALAASLLSPGAKAATPVSEFSGYLAQGYHQLAAAAGKTKSAAASLYKQRSAAAAAGNAVLPLQPDPKKLDGLLFTEAAADRADLMESLGMAARERQPLLAAIAQVNFDCWVAPLPKRKGVPSANDCQSRFYFALAGLPAKKRRAPIASVEAWQVADAPAGSVVATVSSIAAAGQADDQIGSLIQSLSGPSGAMPVKGFDPALASVVIVNSDLPPAMPAGGSAPASVIVGSCEGRCLAMDFIGPGAPPLIQALSDPHIYGLHGQSDNGGEQVAGGGNGSASAGSGSGQTGGAGGGGTSNAGPGSAGSAGGGPAGGGPAAGGPAGGTPGAGGTSAGGTGAGGTGAVGTGSGHGHGHHSGG